MTRAIFLLPALLVLLCVLAAGCTDFLSPAPETPVLTTVPTTVPTTIPVTMTTPTPAPTIEKVRPLPPERQISLSLTKDRPSSEIHLLYEGGPGDMFVTRIILRVYTTETTYEEYIMNKGKKPAAGDEIIAPGTRSPDRCEVFVISSGTRYKVMDENLSAGMYY